MGSVTRTVEKNGTEKTTETQHFVLSFSDLHKFVKVTRKHWAIENNLHWNLDVVYKEDSCRVKKGNAPTNLNILRKVSLCIYQRVKKASAKYVSKLSLMGRCMARPMNIVNMILGKPLA